ncbi:MAG: hypothetical protein IPK27_01520 [Rhodanobacteraceae bacterium]|nr:hypothetical protein [Rhodanobacteraceae bacterium]
MTAATGLDYRGTSAARLATALRAIGNVQLIVALTLLPSILLAWWDGDDTAKYFTEVFALMLGLGGGLILMTRGKRAELRLRDGFLVTTAVWLISALLTPLPLILGPPHLDLADAFFEVVSGLTTTGATTIVGIDELPRSVLLYRQSLHFLGGMGIVVLAVAILPTLRIGGAQLTKGRNQRAEQGFQADAAHSPDRGGAVADLLRSQRALRLGLLARRNELVRRHHPFLRDHFHRRLRQL